MARKNEFNFKVRIDKKELQKLRKESKQVLKEIENDFKLFGQKSGKAFQTGFKKENKAFTKDFQNTFGKIGKITNKTTINIKNDYRKTIKQMNKQTKGFVYSVKEAFRAIQGGFFSSIGGQIRKGLQTAIREGVKGMIELDKGIREVTTLLSTEQVQQLGGMDALKQQAQDLTETFGVDIPNATKAMYQSISSGVDATALPEFMKIAGKLSVGGITGLDTAVDGLTNLANAFGVAYDDAEQLKLISDSLFTGMKFGKTTVDELSRYMAKSAPIASSMGMSFQELIAATSAITTGGVKTSQALTQMNGVLTKILKPSASAKEIMDKLGIAYGQTALEGRNLADWLKDTQAKIENAGVGFEQLFGNIRGLSGVLSLTGKQGEKFNEVMEQMGKNAENAGQTTDSAYKKMEESAEMKFKRLGNKIKNIFIDIVDKLMPVFDQILPVIEDLLPLLEAVGRAVGGIIKLIANSPITKFLTDVLTGAADILAKIVDPIGDLNNEFEDLSKKAENARQTIESLNNIQTNLKTIKGVKALKAEIQALANVAPKLAERLFAVADSSLELSEKIRLVNGEIQRFKEETRTTTTAEASKINYSFLMKEYSVIQKIYKARKEVQKLEAKKNLSDTEVIDLQAAKNNLNNLKNEFDKVFKGEIINLGINKDEVENVYKKVRSKAFYAKGYTIFDMDRSKAEIGIIRELVNNAYKEQEEKAIALENADNRRQKLAEDYMRIIELTQQLETSSGQERLNIETQIKTLKQEQGFITKENAKEEKAGLQNQINYINNAKNLALKFAPDADTSELDRKLELVQERISELDLIINPDLNTHGVEEAIDEKLRAKAYKVKISPEEEAIEDIKNKITTAFDNAPLPMSKAIEDTQENLDYIEAAYKVHYDKIKAMGLENKEEENALILQLEKEKANAIRDFIFGKDETQNSAMQVLDKVEQLAQSEINEEEKAQVDLIIERERQRLQIMQQQSAELVKQYELQKQQLMQDLIVLEEERQALLANAEKDAEIENIQATFDKKRDALEKQRDALTATIDNVKSVVETQQELVNNIDGTIKKANEQQKLSEKLNKESAESAKRAREEAQKQLEEEYEREREAERERQKQESESRRQAEEDARKRRQEEEDARRKRQQEAEDYLKRISESKNALVNDLQNSIDEWENIYGKTTEEISKLDSKTRKQLENALAQQQEEIINAYRENQSNAMADLDLTTLGSVDKAYDIISDTTNAIKELETHLGSKIPFAMKNALDELENELWLDFAKKLDRALSQQGSQLFAEYGTYIDRRKAVEEKKKQATQDVEDEFASHEDTYNALLDSFNDLNNNNNDLVEFFADDLGLDDALNKLNNEKLQINTSIDNLTKTINKQNKAFQDYENVLKDKELAIKQLNDKIKALRREGRDILQSQSRLETTKYDAEAQNDALRDENFQLKLIKAFVEQNINALRNVDPSKTIQFKYDDDGIEKVIQFRIEDYFDSIRDSIDDVSQNIVNKIQGHKTKITGNKEIANDAKEEIKELEEEYDNLLKIIADVKENLKFEDMPEKQLKQYKNFYEEELGKYAPKDEELTEFDPAVAQYRENEVAGYQDSLRLVNTFLETLTGKPTGYDAWKNGSANDKTDEEQERIKLQEQLNNLKQDETNLINNAESEAQELLKAEQDKVRNQKQELDIIKEMVVESRKVAIELDNIYDVTKRALDTQVKQMEVIKRGDVFTENIPFYNELLGTMSDTTERIQKQRIENITKLLKLREKIVAKQKDMYNALLKQTQEEEKSAKLKINQAQNDNERLEAQEELNDALNKQETIKQELIAIEEGTTDLLIQQREEQKKLLEFENSREIIKAKLRGDSELEILRLQSKQLDEQIQARQDELNELQEKKNLSDEEIENDETLLKLKEEQKQINEQIGEIIKGVIKETIELVGVFAKDLAKAFEDGTISGDEMLSAFGSLINDITGKIPGVIGAVVNVALGVLDGLRKGIGSLFKDKTAFNNLKDEQETHREINNIIEHRQKIMKTMIQLSSKAIDSAKEELEAQKELRDVLLEKLGLGLEDPEEILSNYDELLSKYDEIQEAIIALEQDVADDNIVESIGNWFMGWGGASKEDRLAMLNAELESLGLQIESYEELMAIMEEIEDLQKKEIEERWRVAELQAELNDDEEGALQSQIEKINEMLEKADDLGLTELERLELQVELKELYEKQNDELGEQGQLLSDNVRSLIRQVIEARKLGDIFAEQQALREAAAGLLAEGLTHEEIEDVLGADIDFSGITLPNLEIGDDEFLKAASEYQPMIRELTAGNDIANLQLYELQTQNNLLRSAFGELIDVTKDWKNITVSTPSNTNNSGLSSSNFQRLIDEIKKNNRG